MTLTEFLLARIAEDEAVAANWPDMPRFDKRLLMDTTGHPVYAPRTRVLAECEAKRRIVDHADWAFRVEGGGAEDFASFALMALATVYADHPDYDEAWRP